MGLSPSVCRHPARASGPAKCRVIHSYHADRALPIVRSKPLAQGVALGFYAGCR
jgi:hypothetical protein